MLRHLNHQASAVFARIVLSPKINFMETSDLSTPTPGHTKPDEVPFDDASFKPKGAIAFFILLVILGMIIWFGIYFLMLERA